MEMRRLDPVADEQLIREAVRWLDDAPLFFRNCDAAWGRAEDADDYLRHMKEDPQADCGVFENGELIAVVTVSLEGKHIYNSHLLAKRGASAEAITEAIASMMMQMFEYGMIEVWSWLARKNYAVRKILEAAGMRRDGVTCFQGQSHGQAIEWVRYSVRAA